MTKQIHVVGAALINDQGQVLAAKRAADRVLGTLWEFPGGKIEAGESPQAALTRELQEEFHDQITVGPAVGETVRHAYDFGVVNLTVYYARLESQNLAHVAHSNFRWCSAEELGQLQWAAADEPFAKQLAQTKLAEVTF